MKHSADMLAWLSVYDSAVRRRRRIERAAELLAAGATGLWERRWKHGRIYYLPVAEPTWIRWDAGPGRRLELR